MKTRLIALTAAVTLSAPVLACCAIPIGPPIDSNQMRLDEQRAFIFRQGTKEHLILSVQYDGATEEFAWVIPVESRPRVDVLNGAPFNELRKMTVMAEPLRGVDKGAPGGAAPQAAGVQVLERKVAGPYELVVLKATSGGTLYDWLRSNKFQLTKNMKGALDHYVSRDFVFVAARMRPGTKGKQELAQRLKQGNIAPIHLIYDAKSLSYPLRVTAGNPGYSKLEFYVLDSKPDDYSSLGLTAQTFKLTPEGKDGFSVIGPPGAVNPTDSFPTIRKLIPRGGTLTKYTGNLGDHQRQKDLVFD